MNWNARSFSICSLILTLFVLPVVIHAQSNVTSNQPASITILDSTKAQDGLAGSVRRVKTESAKLELKNGKVVEGPRQLVEVTTYDVSGKRIENVSYPVSSTSVGKEEYKYDDRGNMVEMTMRADDGSILSKEKYAYEFDRFGNWTRMVTSLVVFENGELKQEPVEVTYRSLTYYFDDSVAKVVNAPEAAKMPVVPGAKGARISLESGANQPRTNENASPSTVTMNEPPPETKKTPVEEKETAGPEQSLNAASPEPSAINATSSSSDSIAAETRNQPTAAAKNEEKLTTGAPETVSAATVEKNPPKTESPAVATPRKDAIEAYKTGRYLFDIGDSKGAIASYLQSIQLEPKSAEVHLSLGQAYLKLKKDKDAAQAFKESLVLNPNLAEAQYGLGLALFRMGKHRDAANAFKRAIVLRPEMGKAHYGLALAYQELRNQDGLIEEYRVLQNLDRDLAKQLAKAFPDFDLPCRVPPFCK